MEKIRYYAGNIISEEEVKIEIKDEMSKQEVDDFYSHFSFLKKIKPTETAYNVVIRNGREFLSFMSKENLSLLYQNGMDEEEIGTDANRLVYNLCASVKTFIDYAEKSLSDRKNELDLFKKVISGVFDSEPAYRFFYHLRNYCIHYAFPYSKVFITAPCDVDVVCEKIHLLEYKKWGAKVKKDLEKYNLIVRIEELVEPLLVSITAINLMLYFYFTNDYCVANNKIAAFIKKYGLSRPTIVSEDETGRLHLNPIPIKDINDGLEKLRKNPKVTLDLTPFEIA